MKITNCLFALVAGMLLLSSPAPAAENGDRVIFGGNLVVEEGVKVRDAVVIGGSVTVRGTVEHDAVAVGGSVLLQETARVGNSAVAVGGRVVRSSGSFVGGDVVEITRMAPFAGSPGGFWKFFLVLGLLAFIGFLALALLVTALFPRQVNTVASVIACMPWRAALWGAAGTVLVIPLAILLAVSVVGIALIPLEMALVFAAAVFGYIAAAALAGRKVLAAVRTQHSALIVETLLGVVLLALVGMVPVVGWLVTVVAFLLGFGGVLAALFDRKKPPSPECPPSK
ncbi:MAG: hypothetical protein ACYC5N_05900 [Endomicrobiales bacterium]